MSLDITAQSALDTVKRALRLIRVLGEGEEPSDGMAQDGTLALNGLLQSSGIERGLLFELTEESFTWPGSTVSRTIGAAGNFATVRPEKIISAFTRDSANNDTLVQIIEREDYDRVAMKSEDGSVYPDWLFYDPGYPSGTLYLIPPPASSVTLHLSSMKPFTQVTALTTVLAYPPGYHDFTCFNLAIRLAPEYGKTPSDDVKRIARETKAKIKALNLPSMVAQLDPALTGGRHSSILEG